MQTRIKSLFVIAILLLTDSAAIFGTFYAAHHIRKMINPWVEQEYLFDFDLSLAAWPVILMTGFNFFAGLYTQRMDFWEEARRLYRNLFFLLFAIFSLIALAKFSQETSRLTILIAFGILLVTLPLTKLFVKSLLAKTPLWAKKISVYGGAHEYASNDYLFNDPYLGYKVSSQSNDTVLIDTAQLTLDEARQAMEETLKCTKQTLFVPLFKSINLSEATIHDLFDRRQNLINIKNNLLYRHNLFAKKLFELLLVILAFPLLIIPFGLISLMIVLDSKGGVFYFQKRIGEHGIPFSVIKFRTMYPDNAALLQAHLAAHPEDRRQWELYHKLSDDPRVTRVGKVLRTLSLDELPQFLNVLRGDMNLIGPRPYMESERQKLAHHLETITAVAPGITGLWQVSGRNALTFEQRVELDEWYIRNWSLWMDFVIFLKTFDVVLRKKGVV